MSIPIENGRIPKIVLDDKRDTSCEHQMCKQTDVLDGECKDCDVTAGVYSFHVSAPHVPIRSSSDVGLPKCGMPNISIQQLVAAGGNGEESNSENHLGVYCSPRTTRRSVDLDVNLKHEDYWIDKFESSNSLKVFTSSSRVGSTLSLNSECTARSIGLLSNESDSDNDTSISERDKPAQLRRYMSYPEEGATVETQARPSQSLSNLKSANTPQSDAVITSSASLDTGKDSVSGVSSSKNVEPLSVSSSLNACDECSKFISEEKAENDLIRKTKKIAKRDVCFSLDGESGCGATRSARMLSYKSDLNTEVRDGRIRQWLEDMNKQSYSNG